MPWRGPEWRSAERHPHLAFPEDPSNTLYVATDRPRIPGSRRAALTGAGVFDVATDALRLTSDGAASPSEWSLPRDFLPGRRPPLSCHADEGRWRRSAARYPPAMNTTDSLLADLNSRLAQLVDAARAEGRDAALAEIRNLVGGTAAPTKGEPTTRRKTTQRGRKSAAKKSTKKRKNSWAGLTPEQRLARVNAIRKGRGLPLKDAL